MFGYKCQILRGAGPRFGSISSEPHVFLSHMHHTNPSPHQCFEDWCGATSRVLINRSAVLSCPGTSAINGPPPTTVTLTPAVGILSLLVLFASFYILVCGQVWRTPLWFIAVHTHGAGQRYAKYLHSFCDIYIYIYNMIFSIVFLNIYINRLHKW